MFVYADEAGNTGENLFDPDQPDFLTAALITRSDFDIVFGRRVLAIARSVGADQLHAQELGLGKLESISDDLLAVIRKSDARFGFARVEKRYLLATKVVDHVFDSGENLAVPWTVYNFRFMRLLLVFKASHLLDHELAKKFWSALMSRRKVDAKAKFVEACTALRQRISRLPDERSRELFADALEWAIENPEEIYLYSTDKIGRYGHLPNVVGFISLLDCIEAQSQAWDRPVRKIVHDRQMQFERSLKHWHDLLSNASDEPFYTADGERRVARRTFGSELVISSSRDSAGIQVVDTILWLMRRVLRENPLGPRTAKLMEHVFRRGRQFDLSYQSAEAGMIEMDKKYPQLDEANTPVAREMMERVERDRQEKLSKFAAEKRARIEAEEDVVVLAPDPIG